MVIVPTDNPGFNLIRPVPVMGHDGGPGHCEIRYEDCRVPADNLLGPRQAGFVIAQDGSARPDPPLHARHRVGRARDRDDVPARQRARGLRLKLAEKQFVQDFIAKSRMEVEQARLLTMKAAWRMDTEGKKAARREISMIKVVAANVVMDVLDRAIQLHGSLGMSDDTPLAGMWRFSHAADRRRPGRGPQDGHRQARAEPLGQGGRGRAPEPAKDLAPAAASSD